MNIVIPIFYSEYGRYISRYRAIPLNIDGLALVYRRILVSAYQITKNGKYVKSARIVGDTIGRFHPHGDQSCYEALVQLVRRGFLDGDSNFGKISPIKDAPAAAMRYTECRISKWLIDFCFKYYNYVQWEALEYPDSPEPLWLPSPLPLGLIGDNLNSAVAFHKSLIPCYRVNDLAARLKSLLEDSKEKPIIVPFINDCKVYENGNNQFESILTKGVGKLFIIPDVKIDYKKKEIYLIGKCRTKSFKRLFEKDYSRDKIYKCYCLDVSENNKSIILVEPINKRQDLDELLKEIWKDCICKETINCVFSNLNGQIEKIGIDQLLLNNYGGWVYAVKNKRLKDVNDSIKKLKTAEIIRLIRIAYEMSPSAIHTIDALITNFHKINESKKWIDIDIWNDNQWKKEKYLVTEDDIKDVISTSSIKKLIESKLNLKEIKTEIQNLKQRFMNTESDCFRVICELC